MTISWLSISISILYVFYVIIMIYQSIFFLIMAQIGFHIPVGGNFSWWQITVFESLNSTDSFINTGTLIFWFTNLETKKKSELLNHLLNQFIQKTLIHTCTKHTTVNSSLALLGTNKNKQSNWQYCCDIVAHLFQ